MIFAANRACNAGKTIKENPVTYLQIALADVYLLVLSAVIVC
jgi:hypothetical protein